ncbi:MAG: hypothetical protein LUD07_10170, partial [Clostridiales bacterium]|nr:hypothetical protein [Clostridiales bacterium]
MSFRRKLAALLVCALVAGNMPSMSFAASTDGSDGSTVAATSSDAGGTSTATDSDSSKSDSSTGELPDDLDGELENDLATGSEAELATDSEADQDDVYVMMNIPYGDFYESEDVDYYFDVVSTATESKFLGTTGLAKGTYNDGTDILGVVYPVFISGEDYEALSDVVLSENDNYYIAEVLEEEPAAYKTLTYADGTYSFSEATGE